MSKSKFRLPNDTQRLAVIGRTGSGKTQAGVWHLSLRKFETMPWFVLDFKRDHLINSIPGAEVITLKDKLPKRGVYLVQPLPDQQEEVDEFLWRVWEKERAGVYLDEGYMIGQRSKPFNALLTQGRSKHIPMIVLSQRPAWLTRFVWSESDFYQVFHLNDADDLKMVSRFVPIRDDDAPGRRVVFRQTPQYHSHYFDVVTNTLTHLSPVPDSDTILQRFEDRLKPRRTFL
jgi:hypothetical protein